MKNQYCLLGFSTLIISLVACSQALYIPTLEKAGSTEHLNTLMEGRKLYINSCSSCHSLHKPEEFNLAGWQKNLNIMQKRAKISDSQKQLILEYLSSK